MFRNTAPALSTLPSIAVQPFPSSGRKSDRCFYVGHASLCPVLRCMTSLGRSVTARPVVPGPYQGSVAFVLTGVGFVVWITQSAGGGRIDECQEICAARGGGDGGAGGLRWPASKRGAGRDGYHGALFRAGRRRGRAGRRHQRG